MRTVCFCNSNIPWGGGEKWHLEAALALAARGWRVLFLCHPQGELVKRLQGSAEIRVVPLPLGRLSFLNPFTHIRLVHFFRQEGVDTLIMNLPADLKAAGPAAKAAGVRRIVYRRGSALPVRNSLLNRYLYGRVITRLIVNSEATRRMALINNPRLIAKDRIAVLPNGIDVQAFDNALQAAGQNSLFVDAAAQSAGRAALSSGQSGGPRERLLPLLRTPIGAKGSQPVVLGNAGRLTRQKGQHLLLHLCRRLLDAGLNCVVLIAGTGEREAELKKLAEDLHLEDRAVFLGFMDNLAPFWHSIDLFVLTSLWEGFGSVLIESMLARKPVFAFAVSNIPELVFEDSPGLDGNGRLFPLPEEELPHCPDAPRSERDAAGSGAPSPEKSAQRQATTGNYSSLDAMARAILELHPEAAKRMGEAGRRFALGFSQISCMDRLEALLE